MTPDDGPPRLLDTPARVWEALNEAGGLDQAYHRKMDGDIVRSLLDALSASVGGAAGWTRVEDALGDPAVTVERFIGALLVALNPFSTMLADLLAMFERAGAARTDAALRVEFDFGNAPRLAFDLRQFRDWIERLERVRALVRVTRWSPEHLWALNRALRAEAGRTWPSGPAPAEASDWLGEYADGRWPSHRLARPASGDARLDPALARAYEVWSVVVQESSRYGAERDALRALRQAAVGEVGAEGEWVPAELAYLDSDLWAGFVASGMHHVAELARTLPEPERSDHVERRRRELEAVFAAAPEMEVEREELTRVLIEFLNLPVWKRRDELYSAWVMTLIADALSDRDLRFHPVDGVLSFSFGGSHLATARGTDPQLHVWAELRSPLEERSPLSGREAIQPDYSVVAEPITDPRSTVVVVECKQYSKFARGNFSRAVIDYATGRPNARVVLASYGPVRHDFLGELSPVLAGRITLVGGLRPADAAARAAFRGAVRGALPGPPATAAPAAMAPVGAQAPRSIVLTWGHGPSDLDLHLGIRHAGRWTRVDFRSPGASHAFPWAALDRDARGGSGRETITLARLVAGLYRCVVHNYSAEAPLAGSGAEVMVAQGESEVRVSCPRSGDGVYWHVFDFDATAGRLFVVNRLWTADPMGA